MTLEVIHTVTHDGKPLAIVKNLPGLDAEMRPARLRQLAAALLAAADDCERRLQQILTGDVPADNVLGNSANVDYTKCWGAYREAVRRHGLEAVLLDEVVEEEAAAALSAAD